MTAAKYTDVGGQIWVDARTTEDQIVVSIRDDGAGISSELMPRLFKIFEQGRTTLDRSAGGLGIGLALVRNLVELHGGTVDARSDGPGLGSTFTVTLPLATHEEIASPFAAPTPALLDAPNALTLKVLLVDDHVDGLMSMEAFLSEMGFTVATATDPIQALEVAGRFSPTVAVLDIGLPGMSGYELATALREQPQHANLRLFSLTGYGLSEDLKRSAEAGFERHFVKPVALFDLVTALNDAAKPSR